MTTIITRKNKNAMINNFKIQVHIFNLPTVSPNQQNGPFS